MGRYTWGQAVTGMVLAATVAAVSGCGGNAEAENKKPAAPKTVSVAKAAADFKAAVDDYDTIGCESTEPDTCWEQMQAVIEPARKLRKAMNADKSVSPEFYSGAYALINKMEKGVAVGEDLGASALNTNRPDVFGSAHDLSDWLDEHPTK
ncbi:hypothetical protein ABT124_40130 [Streptomyces sp. NPDC001982]|uniref:hypothetical protein n=1 Tax=Streptomyces sp. NPDC001982 TaxID=3154405 RepID=UPI00332A0515